jgi:hypothetical protein
MDERFDKHWWNFSIPGPAATAFESWTNYSKKLPRQEGGLANPFFNVLLVTCLLGDHF